MWNIQRQLLIRALLDRATELGARVDTESAVTDVSPDGTATINGRRLRAELVIGADGVSSVARSSLGLDRPVRVSTNGAIRLLVPRTSYEAENLVREFWSGRLRVGVAPCTRTEAFIYLIAPLSDERGTRVPIDREYWSLSFPRLASEGLFERAHVAPAVHHRYPLVSTHAWSKGRAALVGDAAHALPPTLGQGAGLSLTNTLLLADYVSARPDVREGLAAWERDWRWVSDRTQRWAGRYDSITSEWPRSIYALRAAVIWAIGKSRRFNSYMRVADRVDAPHRTVLPITR